VRVPIFDLDGTLVDSDEALVAPFLALGVRREDITFGHVLADECERLGVDVDAYLAHYDDGASQPFAGIEDLLGELDVWGVCSNKHPRAGRRELERLGWKPEVVLFSDAFDGPKSLAPVIDALGVGPESVVFVGDTDHDRIIAAAAEVPFGLAGWNPRARPATGDVVLEQPSDVLGFCRSPEL
jgi:HAD superfamily hydrolase (TIGR01549 family)